MRTARHLARPPSSSPITPGESVIFPAWLIHQVMPFQGGGERITIAFNAWFRRRDPA
jgi:hypothetical protein